MVLTTKVLFVEDDQVDRMAFERLIRERDLPYDYSLATSLSEARNLLDSHEFDVILSDYFLPDGTAVDLFRLKPRAPIVVITGAGDEEIAVQAMKAGACDYLTKDFERKYLRLLPLTLDNAIRHKNAEKQNKMLSHAIMSINDSVYITDMDDRILYVNKTFCDTYGYSEKEIIGHKSQVLWLGSEGGDGGESFGVAKNSERECLHQRKDGGAIPISLTQSIIGDDVGGELAVVRVARNIHRRKEAEQALRDSEERYALAARGANDGLWDWDLKAQRIYFSPRWKSMLGLAEDDLGDTPEDWYSLVHPEDGSSLREDVGAHIMGHTPHFEAEYRMRHKDGGYRWMLSRGVAERDAAGRAYRMAGSQTDISERKRGQAKLQHEATHDSLTGLANRALFIDLLGIAVERAKRRKDYEFAVLFLDLDRFKVVNDSLGHMVGDDLLISVARRLEACLRGGDTVARLGGDEFAILLEDLDDSNYVTRVADRAEEELERPYLANGQEVFPSASIGIALSSTGYDRAQDLLRDADTAMYRAKALGKARRVVFDPTMHARAMGQLRLETDLRRAVEREEFFLQYQPIVALTSGEMSGFEALVRWRHPDRGVVAPDDFLPVAQETDLIVSIGKWVLEQACSQVKSWHERFKKPFLSISVNVDGRQLARSDLVEQVDSVLAKTGLDPRSLRMEITESAIMEHPDLTISTLRQLKERHIQLYIDDFGTGYSSLSHLHRFPVDTLKIDRSFVSRMGNDEENTEIVATIVALAHNLGLEVMAEGIETRHQLGRLIELQCEYGQGHLFSEALDVEEVEELIVNPSLLCKKTQEL